LKDFERWPTPHFTEGWKSYFKNKPDKPVMHYSVIAGFFGDHMLMYVLPDEADSSVTNKLQASWKVLLHVPLPRVSILSWLHPHQEC
jgi:hypothetical protein